VARCSAESPSFVLLLYRLPLTNSTRSPIAFCLPSPVSTPFASSLLFIPSLAARRVVPCCYLFFFFFFPLISFPSIYHIAFYSPLWYFRPLTLSLSLSLSLSLCVSVSLSLSPSLVLFPAAHFPSRPVAISFARGEQFPAHARPAHAFCYLSFSVYLRHLNKGCARSFRNG